MSAIVTVMKETSVENEIHQFKLKDGTLLPVMGFGTCKHSLNTPVDSVISKAIEAGYRYFDTASYYGTERDLGKALHQSGLKRNEYFVATKLWHEEMGYRDALDAFARSQERLGLDEIDVYMIHWPIAPAHRDSWEKTLIETWNALEELKSKGFVKALGVSNFLPHHLEVLASNCTEKPVIDQLELHLGYFQEYAYQYLVKHDILAQAWSPLGRGRDSFASNPILLDIAGSYNVSVQKLSLRFLLQRGIMPLPWSVSPSHMGDNLDIFNFRISDYDMSRLACMPQQTWLGEHPDFFLPAAKHINTNL